MWKGLAAIAALEVLLLGIVVGGVLSSEPGNSYPTGPISANTSRPQPITPITVTVIPRPPARGGQSDEVFSSNADSGRV
jgi:hypothetical protein